jgi:hypothetical protein
VNIQIEFNEMKLRLLALEARVDKLEAKEAMRERMRKARDAKIAATKRKHQ